MNMTRKLLKTLVFWAHCRILLFDGPPDAYQWLRKWLYVREFRGVAGGYLGYTYYIRRSEISGTFG